MREIEGPGSCGALRPFRIRAAASYVELAPPIIAACPMVTAFDRWVGGPVQQTALSIYGVPLAGIKLTGSYSCRTRNNKRGAKKSEHAFANALDIKGFQLADGREITVVHGWRGTPEDQMFLREVHASACDHFLTVLGPGSDIFHYDHFHLDLARHDARGRKHVCRPKPVSTSVPMAYADPGPAAYDDQ